MDCFKSGVTGAHKLLLCLAQSPRTKIMNKFWSKKNGKSEVKPFVWATVTKDLIGSNQIRVKGLLPRHMSQKNGRRVFPL